jgi:nucleotide-binding universal stress UspA family protein
MLPIKRILVVLEAGREAQPAWLQALGWARVTQASLEVLLPVPPDVKDGLELAPGLGEVAAHNAETAGRHWLAGLLAAAPAGTGQTVVATTDWAGTVLHETRRLEPDVLLLAAGRDDHDLKPLLRQLPCPLCLVRRAQMPQRLGAALGSGAEDAPHRLLNLALLEHLVALGQAFGAERCVLSALPNPVELVPLMGDAYAASYVSSDLETGYREALQRQIADFGLGAADIRLGSGRPDLVLPELARSENIDCLLLGTVARKGLSAFWLGNTAEDVLPRAECDVLLLRPQDYVDPR